MAFKNCSLTGEVVIPKSIQYLSASSFEGNRFDRIILDMDDQPDCEDFQITDEYDIYVNKVYYSQYKEVCGVPVKLLEEKPTVGNENKPDNSEKNGAKTKEIAMFAGGIAGIVVIIIVVVVVSIKCCHCRSKREKSDSSNSMPSFDF